MPRPTSPVLLRPATDRGRHFNTRASSQERTRSQQVSHRVRLGEDQLNKERLELLQQADDTRWSSEGVVIIDDTFTHKTGEKIPNVGKFYDHTVPGYIWGQNLIYADEKTTFPLGFRLYEKDAKRRVELAIDLVDELIEIGVPEWSA